MGRMMPTKCEHGKIRSWGSFGAEDGSSKPEVCADCGPLSAEEEPETPGEEPKR